MTMSEDHGSRCATEEAAETLGMNSKITRRDFAGGTLLGTGAALLGMSAPAFVSPAAAQKTIDDPLTGVGPEWSGPGGVGDYAEANGDTYREVRAAHGGVRNREFDKYLASASDTNEAYDVIIVGGGISALNAAYTIHKERPAAKVLVLENHQMFGGEARRNEIDVDGVRVYGAQGPTGYRLTSWDNPSLAAELGLPDEMAYEAPTGLANPKLNIAHDIWVSQEIDRAQADMLYSFPDGTTALNPWATMFKGTSVPESVQNQLSRLYGMKEAPKLPQGIANDPAAIDRWLDSMTYKDLLVNHLNVDPAVFPFLEEGAITGGTGLGVDMFSAYLAKENHYAGARLFSTGEWIKPGEWFYELPGGNAGLARLFANKLLPGIFADQSLTILMFGAMNRKVFDDSNNPIRIRNGSTVISVRHESAANGKGVLVHYVRDGKVHSTRSKAVVMATQQQIGKRIVRDLPADLYESMAQFHHAPVLTINVALRNWKFMEKRGASAVHFVDGMGQFGIVTQKLKFDGRTPEPCDPSKPICLTMYQPFPQRDMPWPEQATAARLALFGLSYRDIEMQVREQFQRTFASSGFDAGRDIAGIITNRQGHAIITSPPGTFFGKDGKPPRAERVKQGFDRISFGHCDLDGKQGWIGAATNGERAARQALRFT